MTRLEVQSTPQYRRSQDWRNNSGIENGGFKGVI